MDKLLQLWQTTGIYHMAWGQAVMIVVCFGLIYLAIRKGFEPLLLIPIGFGGILANLPVAIRMQASDLATTRLADVLKRNAKAVERYESLAAQGLTMTEADIRFARAHAPHALTALAAASPQLLTISVASMILINEGCKDTVIPDDTDISFDGGNLRVTGTIATLWLMHNSMLWSANRLHVTGDLPQTVITGISGRRLGDIVADTGVDDLTIKQH